MEGQAGSVPGTHPVGPTSSPQEASDLLTSTSPGSGPGGVSMACAVRTRKQRLAWVLWTDSHPGACHTEALHSALQTLLAVSMGEGRWGGCTMASAKAGSPSSPHPC